MKLLGYLALTVIFICGCGGNSPSNSNSRPAANPGAEATAADSQGLADSAEILNQTLKMMHRDLEIFLQTGEYEAALMQIEHYRESIDRLPTPSPEAMDFRNGELYYYQAFCQVKAGEKEKALETLEAGLGQCPPDWQGRAMRLSGELNPQ